MVAPGVLASGEKCVFGGCDLLCPEESAEQPGTCRDLGVAAAAAVWEQTADFNISVLKYQHLAPRLLLGIL